MAYRVAVFVTESLDKYMNIRSARQIDVEFISYCFTCSPYSTTCIYDYSQRQYNSVHTSALRREKPHEFDQNH